jgi:hypothetical protein
MRTFDCAPANGSLERLHKSEEGMLSLVSLFVILAFLIIIGLLANVGRVTSQKIETQNAADAATYSAAVELARGMNTVTAVNHSIGELTALIILIQALVGDTDKQPDDAPAPTDSYLQIAYQAATDIFPTVPVNDSAYNDVKEKPLANEAIWDSCVQLKKVLTYAYAAHFVGGLLEKGEAIPIIGPLLYALGIGIEGVAALFEAKVWQEWETLKILTQIGDALAQLKPVLKQAISTLYTYSTGVVNQSPSHARDAATLAGTSNQCPTIALYPDPPPMPLTAEPSQLNTPAKSQLMRATTPWVQWWRQPLMEFGRLALTLSQFACWFEKRSADDTKTIVNDLKQNSNINLYILKELDLNNSDKMSEPWRNAGNSRTDADKLFTVVGFAYRPAPGVLSTTRIFGQANAAGLVCYAQAMIYNGGQQKSAWGDGSWQRQPRGAWDTLNWSGDVPEYPGPTLEEDLTCAIQDTPQPLISLGWQAKLVPMTQLEDAKSAQSPGNIQNVLKQIAPDPDLSRTH